MKKVSYTQIRAKGKEKVLIRLTTGHDIWVLIEEIKRHNAEKKIFYVSNQFAQDNGL